LNILDRVPCTTRAVVCSSIAITNLYCPFSWLTTLVGLFLFDAQHYTGIDHMFCHRAPLQHGPRPPTCSQVADRPPQFGLYPTSRPLSTCVPCAQPSTRPESGPALDLRTPPLTSGVNAAEPEQPAVRRFTRAMPRILGPVLAHHLRKDKSQSCGCELDGRNRVTVTP